MGIYLSDQNRDCLTNLRFADDVMLFATSREQIQKMLCEFKKATEKVGFTLTRRRFSATRAPSIRTQKDILKSVENLVPPTRDIGNQEQNQSSLGDLP